MIVNHEHLRDLIKRICMAATTPEAEAEAVANHLVEANLKGHDSHGVGMLPAYVYNIRQGHLIPGQHAEKVSVQGPAVIVDGKFGFGQIVGPEAMEWGLEVAAELGMAEIDLNQTFPG